MSHGKPFPLISFTQRQRPPDTSELGKCKLALWMSLGKDSGLWREGPHSRNTLKA